MKPYDLRGTWINLEDVASVGAVQDSYDQQTAQHSKRFIVKFRWGIADIVCGVRMNLKAVQRGAVGNLTWETVLDNPQEVADLAIDRHRLLDAWKAL